MEHSTSGRSWPQRFARATQAAERAAYPAATLERRSPSARHRQKRQRSAIERYRTILAPKLGKVSAEDRDRMIQAAEAV